MSVLDNLQLKYLGVHVAYTDAPEERNQQQNIELAGIHISIS